MKTIKSVVLYWALVTSLAIVSGCENKGNSNNTTKVDGAKLFSDIMFIEGDASVNIPELKKIRDYAGIDKFNAAQKKTYAKYKEFVIADIKKQSPEFFEEFRAMVQSGDPVLVQTALKYAGEKILGSTSTLMPLLILKRNPELIDSLYSKEDKKKLRELAEVSDFAKLKELLNVPDPEGRLLKGLMTNRVTNLQINQNRMVNLFPGPNTNSMLAVNKNRNFDLNFDRDINFNLNTNKNLNLQLDRNLNRLQNLNFNRNIDVNFNRLADIGAGSWFNVNENVNENKNVNVNQNVNINQNVNVHEAVNIAVAVNVVLFAIDNTPMPSDLFGKEVLFQEQLVKSITKQYQFRI
ncbi:hypothetical protein VB264_11710 [Arcicella aquatica]|uniref:Lipoprotein n=1 Tax=Arcicella aquatica TaxID=217141 RepID=A0ABU5QN18_9BACT|nr:hypothetical protein [Arcicella aquatica]MEA5258450.1 hypothetical protein [Arcicella aquatica]